MKKGELLQLLVLLLALSVALAACRPTPTPAPPTPLPTVAATPTVPEAEPPLRIEVTSDPGEDSMAFHVTLTNLASWDMTDVVATATIPEGATLLEASTTVPDVIPSFKMDALNDFSFTLPRLAAGETIELFIYRVEAGPGMFISTQASASWQGKMPGQVTSEPVEISIAVPMQPTAPHITTLALCAEVSEDGRCTSPQIEFQPDVTVYYVFTYENLSASDEIKERWYLGDKGWTEATLNTDYIIKQAGASGRFASSGIDLTASEWERLDSASTGRLEIWLNGELALTTEFTVLSAAPTAQATLLVYNTVERLLAGDLLHTVTINDVQADLTDFPLDWPVVGVGTTDWIGRNGEMLPDGTAGDLCFWWADPNSLTQADVRNLADPNVTTSLDHDIHYPFMGLAVGDPETAITWSLQDVEDVHTWLEERLDASDIDLAGVQLRGEFGPVKTTVAYNIPLTGLDLSGGYVGEDHFRFGEYITATWTINGLYAANPALQPVVSTPGHPLHLHGYQQEAMLGGHVGSASAISVTATVWHLSQVIIRSGEADLNAFYGDAFRRAVQAHFADPTQFHDPHGLMTLGLLREELVTAFGQEQVDDWLDHALAETCLVKTDDGWAGAHVLQPDLPALPSCGSEPSIHFTAELILALAWNDPSGLSPSGRSLDELRRPGWGEELIVPRAELVHWLQRHTALDPWSPGMETQALIVAGVPFTQTWQTAGGETWSVEKLLGAVIERWRGNREKADLKPGDIMPENMLHLAPALIDLFQRYPEAIATYGPVLDEVFATYESALHPDGYWGFPGETFSTGHIVEQYVRAQEAGLNVALPSLRPVELMVKCQAADGWFDIHNNPFIGVQAHGVRALGVTLPLLSSPSRGEGLGPIPSEAEE